MVKYNIRQNTSIKTNTSVEGEHIETKILRILSNKEPIKDGSPIIYTERKDGVQPQYDVRTDRMEIALEAQDSIKKNIIAKKTEAAKAIEEAKAKEGIQGTKSDIQPN